MELGKCRLTTGGGSGPGKVFRVEILERIEAWRGEVERMLSQVGFPRLLPSYSFCPPSFSGFSLSPPPITLLGYSNSRYIHAGMPG